MPRRDRGSTGNRRPTGTDVLADAIRRGTYNEGTSMAYARADRVKWRKAIADFNEGKLSELQYVERRGRAVVSASQVMTYAIGKRMFEPGTTVRSVQGSAVWSEAIAAFNAEDPDRQYQPTHKGRPGLGAAGQEPPGPSRVPAAAGPAAGPTAAGWAWASAPVPYVSGGMGQIPTPPAPTGVAAAGSQTDPSPSSDPGRVPSFHERFRHATALPEPPGVPAGPNQPDGPSLPSFGERFGRLARMHPPSGVPGVLGQAGVSRLGSYPPAGPDMGERAGMSRVNEFAGSAAISSAVPGPWQRGPAGPEPNRQASAYGYAGYTPSPAARGGSESPRGRSR